MARKIDKFVFRPLNRVPKHILDRYLNGKIWELEPKDLLTDDLAIARSKLTSAARARGLKVRTQRLLGNKFVVQAYKPHR